MTWRLTAALLACVCAGAASAQEMPDMPGMDHAKMAHDSPPSTPDAHDMAGRDMKGMDMPHDSMKGEKP